jgi:hypothetical protein
MQIFLCKSLIKKILCSFKVFLGVIMAHVCLGMLLLV